MDNSSCTAFDRGKSRDNADSVPAILTSTPTTAPVDPGTGLAAGSHTTSITSRAEIVVSVLGTALRFNNKSRGNVALIPGIEKCKNVSDMLAAATLDVVTVKASLTRLRGCSALEEDSPKPLNADLTLSADNAEISRITALVKYRWVCSACVIARKDVLSRREDKLLRRLAIVSC